MDFIRNGYHKIYMRFGSYQKIISEPRKENMEIHEAVELIAYLHFDGKIEQGASLSLKCAMQSSVKSRTFPICHIGVLPYVGSIFWPMLENP